MVLGKRWLFSIGNWAKIRPLEMGRKSPVGNLAHFFLLSADLFSSNSTYFFFFLIGHLMVESIV